MFEVRNLSIERKISRFDMKLYKGEILGIAGLMGSGKDELVKSLFGLWPAVSRELFYQHRRFQVAGPVMGAILIVMLLLDGIYISRTQYQ